MVNPMVRKSRFGCAERGNLCKRNRLMLLYVKGGECTKLRMRYGDKTTGKGAIGMQIGLRGAEGICLSNIIGGIFNFRGGLPSQREEGIG